MGHPELFSRACDIRRRAAESNINKARLNNSDVPFYRVEYMFYHSSSMEKFKLAKRSMFQLYYYNFLCSLFLFSFLCILIF